LIKYLQTKVLTKLLTFITLFILLNLLAAGCKPGQQADRGDETGRLTQSEVIIGTLDWQELPAAAVDSTVLANGAAVGDLRIPAQYSRCTAFLINRDTVMTNHHCIPNADSAVGVKLHFRHEDGVAEEDHDIYSCDTFVGNNRTLDFALLKCDGAPGEQWGTVTLSTQPVEVEDEIYVIHQNCDYYSDRNCDWNKKISNGKISKVGERELTHSADTLGGSSGSPLFEADSVVGIHHAGYGNDGSGRGYENYAVSMSKIVPALQTDFPHVEFTLDSEPGSSDPVPVPAPDQDPFEPNNSTSSASVVALPMSSAISTIITSGDQDYFAIDLGEQSEVTIGVEFPHADGDLDIKLLDHTGKKIAHSNGVTDIEEMSQELASGRYYIVVYGYREAANSYQLTLDSVVVSNDFSSDTNDDDDDDGGFWSWWF
jgi:V8-like Glu-specific endopeptidase